MIIVRLMEKIKPEPTPTPDKRRERGEDKSESRIKIESQKRIIAQMQKVLLPHHQLVIWRSESGRGFSIERGYIA